MSEPGRSPGAGPGQPPGRPPVARRPGTLRLLTALGIPIRVHFSFLLLLVWLGFETVASGASFVDGLVFLALLFGCVVLHELGHAAMGRHFGVTTREIVLYPIGGVARIDRIPSGKAELLIALAGPAVNVALIAILFILLLFQPLAVPRSAEQLFSGAPLLLQLIVVNASLLLFNLIPAFPMDGGRVLRSALTFFTGEDRATTIAARVGQGIAVLFALVAVFWNPPQPILLLIAFFVFVGAGQESAFQRQRAALAGLTARAAMVTRFETIAPQESLERAAQLLVATHQHDFPVVDAWGRVVGVLHRGALLEALSSIGREAPVLQVMDRQPRAVPPDLPLERVLEIFQGQPLAPILVVEGDKLLGILTLENLSEAAAISRGLRSPSSPS